jgi:hypothetical protein
MIPGEGSEMNNQSRSAVLPSLLSLGVLFLVTGAAATAGPNAAGVLIVHDVNVPNSTCDPYVGSPAPICATVDNLLDPAAMCPTWKVYAAFPDGAVPRLKSVDWGVAWNLQYLYVGGDFSPGSSGTYTPLPGTTGIAFTQVFDQVRSAQVIELSCFVAYYGGNPSELPGEIWRTTPNPNTQGVFRDDSSPPLVDPIAGYSSIGFGVHGSTICSETSSVPADPPADPPASPGDPGTLEQGTWGRIKAGYRR